MSQTDIEYTVEVVSAENEDSIANNTRTIEIPGIPSQPEYTLGDLNGDGEVTDSDAIYLLYHTFFSEDYPLNQPCDFNGDGEVTDSDAVYLLYYTFFPDEYPLN